jgi:hypothetical protein
MATKSVIKQRMRLLTLKKTTSQLLNMFKEGLKGNVVEKNNNLLQFCTYYNRADPCLSLRL